MGRMVSAKIAKQFGRMIRAWILFAGCTAVAAYVVDAEYRAGHGLGADRRGLLVPSMSTVLRYRAAGWGNSPAASR